MLAEIKDFLCSSRAVKVLVLGDVMLDTYIRGSVERISPEAPVPVLEWDDEYSVPGGAANVACNLSALGCKVRLVGVIGNDLMADKLKQILQDGGISPDRLVPCQGRPTTHKTRVIAHNQQLIRIDREERGPLPKEVMGELFHSIETAMPSVDGVVCSDYAKGLLTPELMDKLLQEARSYRKPVVVDPKGEDFSKYTGCQSITPNEKELSRATGLLIDGEATLEKAANKLMAALRCQSVMVTRGEKGLSLLVRGGGIKHIPAQAKEVYDVTGAGDTVVSVFAMAIFGGLSPLNAAIAANAAGGIVVGKLGTSVVTRGEILYQLQNRELTAAAKIIDLGTLRELLQRERWLGKKVVFTNGCFDPVHRGHILLLEQASRLGDILIVGLNSDSSVKRLKGDNRPSLSQEDRAYILGALESVNYVIIFHEDTPESLIREIRPHILVKGDDYSLDEVVGREIVEGYGGKVELIPRVADKSSTKYLNSIMERGKGD